MDGVSRTLTRAYNVPLNRITLTHADGQAFTYLHDAAGALTGLYQGVGTAVTLGNFAYNGQGLLGARSESGGAVVNYGYDPVGRLIGISDLFAGGAGDVSLGFSHNPASQIVSRSRSNDAYVWTGAYDVSRSYTVNGLNQYLTAGPAAFGYDANGNLTSDGSSTFTYDVENRLVAASGSRTASLRYDPLGRLYEASGASGTTRFLYDGDAMVAEYAGGAITARHVHGLSAGADDPLVWYDGGTARWLHRRENTAIRIGKCMSK